MDCTSLHCVHRLHTGWSTGRSTPTALNSAERDAILGVIQRNELLECAERQRIGKIIDRVDKIKQRAADCGPRNCRYEIKTKKTTTECNFVN